MLNSSERQCLSLWSEKVYGWCRAQARSAGTDLELLDNRILTLVNLRLECQCGLWPLNHIYQYVMYLAGTSFRNLHRDPAGLDDWCQRFDSSPW